MLPIYARTTPLIVLFILAVTVVPVGFRAPSIESVTLTVDFGELISNVLLFFPLGLILGELGLLRAGCWGALLSMGLEASQFFLDSRHPEPGDIVANTLGALCGAAVGRGLSLGFGWRFDRFPVGRVTTFGAVLSLMVFAAAFHYRASLWIWDPSYTLAVGDEATQDRTWDGDIFEVAIFDIPIDSGFIRTLADQGAGSIAANQAFFPAAPVFELTNPVDLAYVRGHPLLEGSDTRRFFDSLVGTGNFTVLLWCRPATLDQFGPARIITYSLDENVRNFTLGQEGPRVQFRLRTLISGLNGTRIAMQTDPLLNEKEDVLLAVSYDGQVSRIYVNGRLAGEEDFGEPSLFWLFLSAGSHTFLPGTAVLLGALVAIAFLGLIRPRGRCLQTCVAGVAGVMAGLLLLATAGGEAHPLLGPFLAVLSPVGALGITGPES